MMRSSNPALNANLFRNAGQVANREDAMTVAGTGQKMALLLLLVFAPAVWLWSRYGAADMAMYANNPEALNNIIQPVMPWMFGGMIGGFIVAMITIFKKKWAMVTAPLYAVLEGLFLGAISMFFEARFPGIVVQAVGLTFGVAFVMAALYATRIIRVTNKLRMAIFAATGGIMLLYLASMVMGFFGASIPLIHSSGTFGILFSLVVVGVAAFNLLLDFDFIERGAQEGAPKYLEWYGAFGLLVTLVWLYLEILRLLSKLRGR